MAGQISCYNICLSTRVTSTLVASSSGFTSVVFTAHFCSSTAAQVPAVSTTVDVTSSIPSGLPSSLAVEPSSIPSLWLQDVTVSEVLQGAMDIFRKQRDAATCPAISRFADLDSVRNGPAVASATINGRN